MERKSFSNEKWKIKKEATENLELKNTITKRQNTIWSQRQNQVYGGKHQCLDNRLIKLSILINQKNNNEKPEHR